MTWSTIQIEKADGIALLTLNRPEARNALDLTMRADLEGGLTDLAADAGVRVLIVRGAGGHFCSGGDVKFMRSSPPAAGAGQARVEALNRVVGRLVRFPSPTIAMVDGVAVGAGMNLALACDLIVASDCARFGEVFAKIGLIPDGGGTYLLARRIGLGRAKELCFTAEVLDAQEAARIGIVNRVVAAADLERETRALAEKIAAGPPRALAAAKVLLDRGLNLDLDTCLAWEAISQGLMMETADHREGLAAFFEKRAPRFIGA